VAPEGSIFNSGPTAASFASSRTTMHLMEMILAALAPALPGEIPAMSGGDPAGVTATLRHERRGPGGMSVFTGATGFGARHGADGASAI